LIFLDGDCVVPPNFLSAHAELKQKGVALCGDCMRLSESNTKRVTDQSIREGNLHQFVDSGELRRMSRKARKDRIYGFFRVPMRPRMIGNQLSLWREDFERIGGFDLGYRGWGLEDSDLQRRLLRAGIRCKTALPAAGSYHLWHPPVETYANKTLNNHNEDYYHAQGKSNQFVVSGLDEVSKMPHSVWRWRDGNLLETQRIAG
jgi:hypothetical protein